jgi:hypothetical protein
VRARVYIYIYIYIFFFFFFFFYLTCEMPEQTDRLFTVSRDVPHFLRFSILSGSFYERHLCTGARMCLQCLPGLTERQLCWRQQHFHTLVREDATHKETRNCQYSEKNLVMDTGWEPDTKIDWPIDRRSIRNFNFSAQYMSALFDIQVA